MANTIDENGLTTDTLDESVAAITTDLKGVYGDDINVDSDSPDGQMINIFALAKMDVLDLLTQVYNSFNPDTAVGKVLDQRVAINGIQRLGGTYTTSYFALTVTKALTLVGLDSATPDNPPANIYTIKDAEGNYFYLTTSQILAAAGSYNLQFTAEAPGKIQVVSGQTMSFVSVVSGCSAIATATRMNTVEGTDEETDAALRLRRQQSVSLASSGFLESLVSAVKNISGVTYATAYENITAATDSDGIPAHGIWVIVEGGIDSDIAYAIYKKRSGGSAMKGSTVVVITRVNGVAFQIKFDRTSSENIYIKFDAKSISGAALDTTYLAEQIVANASLDVNQSISSNDIAALVRAADSNCYASNILISNDNTNWYGLLSTTAKNYRFALATARIAITVVT